MAAELTAWQRHKVSLGPLMLPAHWRHVSQLTYLGHWHDFTPRQQFFGPTLTETDIWEPISGDESERSPWFPPWEILIRRFLLVVSVWQEKKQQEADLIFALVIESGVRCYQNAIHLNTSEGSRSWPLQNHVMWRVTLSLASWWKDEWRISLYVSLTYGRWVAASFLCKLSVRVQDLEACRYIFLREIWIWNGLRLTGIMETVQGHLFHL